MRNQQSAVSKKSKIQPPTHPSPSRGEGKGGGKNLVSGLWSLRSEKGIALVIAQGI